MSPVKQLFPVDALQFLIHLANTLPWTLQRQSLKNVSSNLDTCSIQKLEQVLYRVALLQVCHCQDICLVCLSCSEVVTNLLVLVNIQRESHLSGFSYFWAEVNISVIFGKKVNIVKNKTFEFFLLQSLFIPNIHKHSTVEWQTTFFKKSMSNIKQKVKCLILDCSTTKTVYSSCCRIRNGCMQRKKIFK